MLKRISLPFVPVAMTKYIELESRSLIRTDWEQNLGSVPAVAQGAMADKLAFHTFD